MTHAEYLADLNDKRHAWRVLDYRRAIFVVWGRKGRRDGWLGTGMILLPAAILAVYAVATGRWSALVWPVLAVLAFGTGRGDIAPAGGCLWYLAFFVGLGLSIKFGYMQIVGGALTIFTYFAAGLFKCTIFHSMSCHLRVSPETFDRLAAEGLLSRVEVEAGGA